MNRKDLLNIIDPAMLDALYGFCYRRCTCSADAEDLCSDIVLAVAMAASGTGDVRDPVAFIWRIAHNRYAEFSRARRISADAFIGEDPDPILSLLPAEAEEESDDTDALCRIYREIAFLSYAYRTVMIRYYLEGAEVATIAAELGVQENAVRQRLFSARNIVRKEVLNMKEITDKPLPLQTLNFTLWGTGSPGSGDPRTVCNRQLSKHVVWLCRQGGKSAREVSDALHLPMLYAEEELELQVHGENGKYGMLRKAKNGKYETNVLLLDTPEILALQKCYLDRLPMICKRTADFIEAHKDEYLAFPYRNHKVDLNLILWQQVAVLADQLKAHVQKSLSKNHFADVQKSNRPFTVFGYRATEDTPNYGGGLDDVNAQNVCGFKFVHLANIYITRIRPHFRCGHNVAVDEKLQLALRAIDGLPMGDLTEKEQEAAAKAVQCGYLYREGDRLYTKILVHDEANDSHVFDVSRRLGETMGAEAELLAAEIAEKIRAFVPERLLGDYVHANTLAGMPVEDLLVEDLIERGLLTPPENGVGAEGCWMSVSKE